LENLEGRDYCKDLDVDGNINIRINLREIGWGSVDWIHLSHDTEPGRAVMNTLMNLRFYKD
jgi:hypothetical protein